MANTKNTFITTQASSGPSLAAVYVDTVDGYSSGSALAKIVDASILEFNNATDGMVGSATINTGTPAQVSTTANKFAKSFTLKNGGTNGIYIGANNTFTAADSTCYLLGAGEVLTLPYYSLSRLYFVTSSGTSTLYWIGF